MICTLAFILQARSKSSNGVHIVTFSMTTSETKGKRVLCAKYYCLVCSDSRVARQQNLMNGEVLKMVSMYTRMAGRMPNKS